MLSLSWIRQRRLRIPIPLVDIVEPNVEGNDNDNNDNEGAVLRGGGGTNEWDYEEVVRRRRATEDDAMTWEDRGGMTTCKNVVLWLEFSCIHRNYI